MIRFRTMIMEDIPSGLSLCRHAGWNQIYDDWELFLKLSPKGCCVAVDEAETVVGTVATLNYEDHFSWIGMVLVHPAFQKQGIGTQLLREALQQLGNQATIKLDATPAGRKVYLKLNFADECRIFRMHHPGGASKPGPTSSARPMEEKDLQAVFKFDNKVFGANRRRILERNLARAPQYALVVEERGRVRGFCFGRPGHNFDHIGPVVAQRFEDAAQLLLGAMNETGGKATIVDAMDHNLQWTDFISALGFSVMRPLIRMYRGSNSHLGAPAQQFAILGPEFG